MANRAPMGGSGGLVNCHRNHPACQIGSDPLPGSGSRLIASGGKYRPAVRTDPLPVFAGNPSWRGSASLAIRHIWIIGDLDMLKNDLTRPTDATTKRLFARSGNRCAFPKCTVEIVHGNTLVGEICHIKAARPGGPRYDPRQTGAERHGYDNLILLCGTHHTVIDDDEEAYTIERLIKMKTDHEHKTTALPDDRAASGTRLLINQFVSAIGQSGGITAHTINIYPGQSPAASAQSSAPHPVQFSRLKPKDGPARFRAPGDPIGIRDDYPGAENSIALAAGPAMWLRLIPTLDPGKTWSPYELRTALGQGTALQPFRWGSLYGCGGLYRLRARDGIGTCSLLSPEAHETSSVALPWRLARYRQSIRHS